MRPRIQPDAPSSSLKHAKRILWGLAIIAVLGLASYFLAPLYIFYYVPEELPPYDIPPRVKDDTLRIAIIGDSWADYHTSLSGDTIIANAAEKITSIPVKTETRGKKGALSKEIYYFMFEDKTIEHSYEQDRCTQPLIEAHPDYCVIFAGINDVTYMRQTSFFAENLRLIINLLLHNGIRPVVMEIPTVNFKEPYHRIRFRERWFYRIRSVMTGTFNNEGTDYQKALTDMLASYQLKDSVLYITAKQWNPKGCLDETMFLEDHLHLNLGGYQKLDSCIATEIINDYAKRH